MKARPPSYTSCSPPPATLPPPPPPPPASLHPYQPRLASSHVDLLSSSLCPALCLCDPPPASSATCGITASKWSRTWDGTGAEERTRMLAGKITRTLARALGKLGYGALVAGNMQPVRTAASFCFTGSVSRGYAGSVQLRSKMEVV